MRNQLTLLWFLAAAFSVGNIGVSADEITLIPAGGFTTGANVNALAGPLFSSDLDSVDVAGPGFLTASAAKDGSLATHESTVELDYSMGPAFFESSFVTPFSRTALLDHRASAESIFHFTVDSPVSYDVSGFLSVSDEAAATVAGNVELEIELLEFDGFDPMAPPPEVRFYSYQVSKSTLNESFMVGGFDGDDVNVVDGLPMGVLDPTKFYRYRTLVTINAIDIDGSDPLPPSDGIASATGGHVIMFTPTAVPEPSTGLVFGVLAIGGMLFRRRSGCV